MKNFFSGFGPNDTVVYNKNIGFWLLQNKAICPINILNDPFCLDFVYINENQRSKGHGKNLMKFTLNPFQLAIHTLDSSLGFLEHIRKDLGFEN